MIVPNYKNYTISTKKNIILYSKNNDTIRYDIVVTADAFTDVQKYRRCAVKPIQTSHRHGKGFCG